MSIKHMLEKINEVLCFGGKQLRYKHQSEVLSCEMHFSIFLPAEATITAVPVVYWLSGLTCNDENFVTKAGAQRFAAEYGIAIVCPDTSPRGVDIPDDPEGAYDFGLGAGFYVNATENPWATHYRMYDYVLDELPGLINKAFPVDNDRMSISGHSMGGHGALTIALKNAHRYKSVSAFAPICSPINCPWGQKALTHYLGGTPNSNNENWLDHDTVMLVQRAGLSLENVMPVLVDQGDADNFLAEQLNTQLLIDTAKEVGFPMQIRFQAGYDHSYFFIATFIDEHIKFHAQHLHN